MIPLILGAVALGTAAVGAMKGSEGVGNMNEAKEIVELARKRYEYAVSQLEADWEATNRLAEEYGQLQLDVIMRTIGRFVAFIERLGQRNKKREKEFLEGLDGVSIQQLQEYKTTVLQAGEAFKGVFSAGVAGAAAGSGAIGLAQTIGTVSVAKFFGLFTTEVAISQLGGAAALQGAVAWLGGGGLALGGVVLGGITLGPALAVSGFMLASKGEEALTEVRKYEAKVNTEIATVTAARDFLQQAKQRITELSGLVEDLNTRAVLSLNDLESKPFDRNRDASKFQQTGLLVKALAEIIKTPVLDSEGQLNPATVTIKARYRTLGGFKDVSKESLWSNARTGSSSNKPCRLSAATSLSVHLL